MSTDEANAIVLQLFPRVLKTLSYREREILKLRFGLGDGYSYTLEEIGHIFKVTRERIRGIEKKAIEKLSKRLETEEFANLEAAFAVINPKRKRTVPA